MWLRRLFLVMFVLLTVLATGGWAWAEDAMEQPMLGEPAPDLDLPATEGDGLALSSLRGQYVVIHFGASW